MEMHGQYSIILIYNHSVENLVVYVFNSVSVSNHWDTFFFGFCSTGKVYFSQQSKILKFKSDCYFNLLKSIAKTTLLFNIFAKFLLAKVPYSDLAL